MDNIKLSIILPVFNGAEILQQSLEKLSAWISGQPYKIELIVVNDGSDDTTPDILEKFNGKLDYYYTINLPKNREKGFAVRAGIKAASGAYIVFTDTDLSYGMEIFSDMYKFMNSNKDIYLLYGSRAHSLSRGYAGYTLTRRLSSLLFSGLARFLILPGVKDTQCGVKMFKKEFAILATEKLTVDRFAFDIEMLIIAQENHLKFQDFPVALYHREATSVRLVKDAFSMFKDILRMKIKSWLGRYKITLLIITAIFVYMVFYGFPDSPAPWFDEGINLGIAKSLVTRGVFSLEIAPNEFIKERSLLITTNYPLLLWIALSFKIFGIGLWQAKVVMFIFLFIFAYLFYSLCAKYYGARNSLMSLALLVTFLPLYGNGKSALGEIPGLTYFLGGLLFWESEKKWRIFTAGLLFGLAAATKP